MPPKDNPLSLVLAPASDVAVLSAAEKERRWTLLATVAPYSFKGLGVLKGSAELIVAEYARVLPPTSRFVRGVCSEEFGAFMVSRLRSLTVSGGYVHRLNFLHGESVLKEALGDIISTYQAVGPFFLPERDVRGLPGLALQEAVAASTSQALYRGPSI